MVVFGLESFEIGSAERSEQVVGETIGTLLTAPRSAERAARIEGNQRAIVFDARADLLGDAVVARARKSCFPSLQQRNEQKRPYPADHATSLVDLTTRRKFSRMRFPCSVPMDSGWN